MLSYPADMAELADAPDLGSGVPDVKVQVLSGAPRRGEPFGSLRFYTKTRLHCIGCRSSSAKKHAHNAFAALITVHECTFFGREHLY